MAFGIVTLTAMILYPPFKTFADDDKGNNGPEVKSSMRKCKGKRDGEKCECKTQNEFKTRDDVYAKGEHFPTSTNVDIYVIKNKKWKPKNRFGPLNPADPQDESSDGAETVATNLKGEIPCTKIWGNPLTKGLYDIVVDANQDGTYDPADGDAIDGKSKDAGFRVR